MSGITCDIETIMDVMARSQEEDCVLTITEQETCWIEGISGDMIAEFNDLSQLYSWTAEQQDKLDEQRKEQIKQQAKDYRDSEPTKHRF